MSFRLRRNNGGAFFPRKHLSGCRKVVGWLPYPRSEKVAALYLEQGQTIAEKDLLVAQYY